MFCHSAKRSGIKSMFKLLIAVDGAHCFGRQAARRECGVGTRCLYGHYCVAFCKHRRPSRSVDSGENGNGSTSGEERTETVEIEYKVPLVHLVADAVSDIDKGNLKRADMISVLEEIADQLDEDAENCDTSANEIGNIASHARSASVTMKDLEKSAIFTNKVKKFFGELETMLRNLDDSDLVCEVGNDSPLASRGVVN